ncbi:hypothetical protein C7212DRAFT_327171 [Tuber magnatum]|uniref:Uncharacterized protein n=1 Tax=Tuber magnatum TaxID=42249 RepID=A0A317SJ13_9PEZI|nr:hypothetical protein C7212DRAFT_327171 [Tuber magnatum]
MSNPPLQQPTQASSYALFQSEPMPAYNCQHMKHQPSGRYSLLHRQNQRLSTPPLRAPSPGIPVTPKTPKSLKRLTHELSQKARDRPCARKKIPTQGQAFATAEDLRRWRRDIIAEKKENSRSRVRQSLDTLCQKQEELEGKVIPVSAKISLLDDKLAEFIQEGLEATDDSDLDGGCEGADENSESDDSIGPDIGYDDVDLDRRIGKLD